MKNKKNQQASTAKFIMTITIIMMIGTLLGAVVYLAQKVPCGLVDESYKFKNIIRNETDSWQVYSDEKYNFQVKYPKNISSPSIEEKENAGKKELQKEINFNINDDSRISIYVWYMEASEGNDLAEVKEKYNEVSVGGNYGWQSKQSNGNVGADADLSSVYSYETYLYSKDYIYQIEYRGIYGKENFDLYQNMVSTFEFTETKKDETADWKTYRNEEYGFEVKYYPDLNLREEKRNETGGQFTYLLSIGFNAKNLNGYEYGIRLDEEKILDVYREELIGHVTDKINSEEKVLINGNTWTKINYFVFSNSDSIPFTMALAKRNGYNYIITSSTLKINQILSTFKFTEK